MKRIVLFLLAAVALVSCEDNKPKNQVLDPLAKISIRAEMAKHAAPTRVEYATPLEVVQKTTDIVMQSKLYPNEPFVNYGIADEQRDTAQLRIMMWGMWVINNGQLTPDFIEAAYDVIFVTREGQLGWNPITDTLAYIPNAVLRAAEIKIKAAYEAEDYTEVYRLFDEAYRFNPINGADWLKLKEKGEN